MNVIEIGVARATDSPMHPYRVAGEVRRPASPRAMLRHRYVPSLVLLLLGGSRIAASWISRDWLGFEVALAVMMLVLGAGLGVAQYFRVPAHLASCTMRRRFSVQLARRWMRSASRCSVPSVYVATTRGVTAGISDALRVDINVEDIEIYCNERRICARPIERHRTRAT